MAISLAKGDKPISLVKSSGESLTKISMGLGWDPAGSNSGKSGSFFSKLKAATASRSIDLDASVIMCSTGGSVIDTVFFGHKRSNDGSIVHSGDNLTGAGDGDDEVIKVDLTKVSNSVTDLVFVINSYSGQTFNEVENVFARVMDEKGKEMVRYNLAESASNTGVYIAKVSRNSSGKWEFAPIGEFADGQTAMNMAAGLTRVL